MLSVQEALLLKAAEEEKATQQGIASGGVLGAIGGAGIGALGGAIPHKIGQGINALSGRKSNRMKPGFRMAGGLTGMIMGGGLGAGMAMIMGHKNEPAQILAKLQSGQEMTEIDKIRLGRVLENVYSNQSQLG